MQKECISNSQSNLAFLLMHQILLRLIDMKYFAQRSKTCIWGNLILLYEIQNFRKVNTFWAIFTNLGVFTRI